MKEIIESATVSFTHKNIDRTYKNPRDVKVVTSTNPSLIKIITDEGKPVLIPITSISSLVLDTKNFDDRILM